MLNKEIAKAVAYLRTSSATNVDGDSEARQLAAINDFAKSAGYSMVEIFRDQAVKGTDPVDQRRGFRAMLERLPRTVRKRLSSRTHPASAAISSSRRRATPCCATAASS